MAEDIRYCPLCYGYIEAGGDDFCICDDADDYGDYLYHQQKDGEAERRDSDGEE